MLISQTRGLLYILLLNKLVQLLRVYIKKNLKAYEPLYLIFTSQNILSLMDTKEKIVK